MTVDLFTFVAQVINFVILLLLLRRFLYRPITRVMRDREERIADAHARAERAEREAEEEGERLRAERGELERTRDEHLADIERQARDRRRELLEEARQAVTRERHHWLASLRDDQEEVLERLRRDAGGLLHDAVAAALADFADLEGAELDVRIARTFADRLDGLDEGQLRPFRRALASDPRVRVSSATPLPQDVRDDLERAVRSRLSADAEVRFERRAELIAGVVLEVRDHRLSWNLEHYLDDLVRAFRRALERGAAEAPATGAALEGTDVAASGSR